MTDERASRPHRERPPFSAALVRWPASFGTRFAVFCDVEEEFDWRAPFTRTAHSTRAMHAFPDAHRHFAGLGIAPVCMVAYPVAVDPAAVAILARAIEDGRTAIGAQLHPWVTPPFDEPLTGLNSYAGNLAPALEASKIDRLTDVLTSAFGQTPMAFRSGRYGIGASTRRLLADRGYRLDSSVRARYDYRAYAGPDFQAVGNAAYRVDGLVELPFTTVFTGALRRGGGMLYRLASRLPHGAGALARAGLVNRVSLTPEDMPIEEAIAAVDAALQDGERLLCFSFHSPSLQPGHTPYVRDARDLAHFWNWWERMAAHLHQRDVMPASLGEILAAAG